jgi:hypothetical protein
MLCPDKGNWQAFLDGEVSALEKTTLERHVQECPQCQQTLVELSDLAMWSTNRLTKYQSFILDNNSEENKVQSSKGRDFWMKRSFKKWAAVAASVVVLTGALTFTPVQDAVADLLSIFRVQKIETVKINPEQLNQMARDIEAKAGQVDLQQFGEVEFTSNNESQLLTLTEAQNEVVFNLKNPTFVPEGFNMEEKVNVTKENTAKFSLNVEQVNTFLKSLGAKTLLPESLAGQAFTMKTPDVVHMAYYNNESSQSFSLLQYNSPEIKVPDGVNPNELRAALLDLPILPADLRNQLAAINDWQNTMVLPEIGDSEQVTIAGNEAIYNKSAHGDYGNLMWVDNGVIYQISGVLDRDSMIKIAQSIY